MRDRKGIDVDLDDPNIHERFYDIIDSDEDRNTLKEYSIPSSSGNSIRNFDGDEEFKEIPSESDKPWVQTFREIQAEVESAEDADKPRLAKKLFKETYPWPRAMPDSLMDIFSGVLLDGDCGRSQNERPDWLDPEKFRRGQKFARDHLFGVFYAEMLSLMMMFSFPDGLSTLILTGKSGTPYTAFRRYLSTSCRVRRWYTEDPWSEGSQARNDIKQVRLMHENVRKRLATINKDELKELATIHEPWSTVVGKVKKDFESACPAPKIGQCPYALTHHFPDNLRIKGLSQAEMGLTQFGFFALIILYPRQFGIHDYSDSDLDDFCHVWRGLGYLLGVRDEFNVCNGSLEEIKARSRDFLEYLIKPNFREMSPEWEHMMRCVIAGMQYYFPGSTFETSLLYLSDVLNLNVSSLRHISFKIWLRHQLNKFFFNYAVRIKKFANYCNQGINRAMDRAAQFDEEKHIELQKRSDETEKFYRRKKNKKSRKNS